MDIANTSETCYTTNNTDLRQCYGHGDCVWGYRFNYHYCQCSRYWDFESNCQQTLWEGVGGIAYFPPIISIVLPSIYLIWMTAEILADRLQSKKFHKRAPAFYAKLLAILSSICFIISSSLVLESIRQNDVVFPIPLIAFEGFSIYFIAATSCVLVTSWLTMIAKVKNLSEKDVEGKWLRRSNYLAYGFLVLSGLVFIGVGILQALNYQPLTMSYCQLFILLLYTAFVFIASVVNLVRLTKWINNEAQDSRSKLLKKIKRKNAYIIANVVLNLLAVVAFWAYTQLYNQPKPYIMAISLLRIILMAELFCLCMFLENHLTNKSCLSGYIRAFQGIESSSTGGPTGNSNNAPRSQNQTNPKATGSYSSHHHSKSTALENVVNPDEMAHSPAQSSSSSTSPSASSSSTSS